MEVIGYFAAALVGISLGVLGSGGSILTVPIMVYLLNINPVDATGYSLFVVGLTSAIGGVVYIQRKLVNFRIALIFAVPSIISVFFTRKLVMAAIPGIIFITPSFTLTKELAIMILFALLMIIVAYKMIRKSRYLEPGIDEVQSYIFFLLIAAGLVSGVLTGILGVGGGFIIIPALVLYAKIPVRMSVGTSLLIIAFNSLSGFTEEVMVNHAAINYSFLFLFSLFSVAGIFIGFRISLKLRSEELKKMFGWFILVMGICVFIKEVFLR